jgi:hypothetical protein
MIDGVGNNCDEALINAFKKVGIEHPDKLAGDIDYKLIKEIPVVYIHPEIVEA